MARRCFGRAVQGRFRWGVRLRGGRGGAVVLFPRARGGGYVSGIEDFSTKWERG